MFFGSDFFWLLMGVILVLVAAAWLNDLAGVAGVWAVAMVSGSSTGWPRTMGAAPAAWYPHICGRPVALGWSTSPPTPLVAEAYSE